MTLKQKLAVEKMVENGGNKSKAMLEAGYSPATAKTPQKLTESKGFELLLQDYRNELLAKGINGKKMAQKMDEWLEAKKVISAHNAKDANAETDDFIEVPDYQTQLKAGEMLREDLGIKSSSGPGVAIQINNSIQTIKDK